MENNQKAINNTNWPNKSCSSGISGVSAFPIYFSNRPVSVSSIDRDKETHKAKVSLAEDDAATTVRQRHLIEISHQAGAPVGGGRFPITGETVHCKIIVLTLEESTRGTSAGTSPQPGSLSFIAESARPDVGMGKRFFFVRYYPVSVLHPNSVPPKPAINQCSHFLCAVLEKNR